MKVAGTAIVVAGVAAAAAATGGASLALGGAAGRFAASSGGRNAGSRLAGRLSLAANRVASATGRGMVNASRDFITGRNASGLSLGDDQSIRGKALNYLREKSLTNIKSGTGGYVDIKGLEKTIADTAKKAAANVEKEAERIGPQKSLDRIEQINNTKENIDKQTEEKIEREGKKPSYKGQSKDLNEIETLEKELIKTAERKLDLEKEEAKLVAAGNLSEAQNVTNKIKLEEKYEQKLKDEQDKKKQEVADKGKFDIGDFDKVKEEFNKEREAVAKEMGLELSKLDKELITLSEDVIKKTKERNDFIKRIAESGGSDFGLYNKKDAQKIADKLRGQKGKRVAEDDIIANIKKALETKP
jgi:hypothetical protein